MIQEQEYLHHDEHKDIVILMNDLMVSYYKFQAIA